MIEILDRMLQLLKDILLPLAVSGNVGQRPDRISGLALAIAERTDSHPQPAAMRTVLTGKPDLFLLPLALRAPP